MGRPKWFKVAMVVVGAFVAAALIGVVVMVLKPAPVGAPPTSTPSVTGSPGAVASPTPVASPAPLPSPTGVPVEPAVPDGALRAADATEFAAQFARVWMAPSPGLYDYATYEAFLAENFRAHPTDSALTLAAQKNIYAWQVTDASWESMAQDATIQTLEVTGAGVPPWVTDTDVGTAAMDALREAGYGEVYLVEVRGNVLSSTTSGGQVAYEARALFGVLCDTSGCGLGDVLTYLYDNPQVAAAAGEL